MMAIPAMLTPSSRARLRINSSRSRSSSVYKRVFPTVREGCNNPSRSYSLNVCGWISYISATAEIMYAPFDLRFVGIFRSRASASYAGESRLSGIFWIQLGKLTQDLFRTLISKWGNHHLYGDNLVAAHSIVDG